MATFISLLRGINVSGKKQMRMPELQSLYQSLGFTGVQTYLQSGNVLFQCGEDEPASLSAAIEAAIRQTLGYDVPVLILTPAEMENIYTTNPFLLSRQEDHSRLHVTFLWNIPEQSRLAALPSAAFAPDEYSLQGKTIFLFCPNGYGRTKLNNTFFEKKLGLTATTRNWNTVSALVAASQNR